MLDPREQKKGGFGAFVAREQERHDARELARTPDAPSADAGERDAPAAGATSPDADDPSVTRA